MEPEISQAMVYGDKRPHLVALIVPSEDFAKEWAAENGTSADLGELGQNDAFRRAIDSAVTRVNAGLANNEKVRRFKLIGEAFTTDNAMMTPSLKVRRHIVVEKYGADLIALY